MADSSDSNKPAHEEAFQAFQAQSGGVTEYLIVRASEVGLLRSSAEEGRRARIFWNGLKQALDDREAGKEIHECVCCGAVIEPRKPLGAVVLVFPHGVEHLHKAVHWLSAFCCVDCGSLDQAELRRRYEAASGTEPIHLPDEGTA